MKNKRQREDKRWGRNIQIWVVSRSRSSLSFVSRSLRNSHPPSFSLFLLPSFFFGLPPFPPRFSLLPQSGIPPVSYYSPVVRHCTHRTKHHGDSPAALSARDIWQYPNERSTEETTWEETRRRKVGWIKKEERAGEIVSAPERVTTDFRPIVNREFWSQEAILICSRWLSLTLRMANLQNQLPYHWSKTGSGGVSEEPLTDAKSASSRNVLIILPIQSCTSLSNKINVLSIVQWISQLRDLHIRKASLLWNIWVFAYCARTYGQDCSSNDYR